MGLHDYGKALLLGLVIVSVVILLATHSIDSASGIPIITLVVGYLTGNGQNAVRRNAPSPVFGPTTNQLANREPQPVQIVQNGHPIPTTITGVENDPNAIRPHRPATEPTAPWSPT